MDNRIQGSRVGSGCPQNRRNRTPLCTSSARALCIDAPRNFWHRPPRGFLRRPCIFGGRPSVFGGPVALFLRGVSFFFRGQVPVPGAYFQTVTYGLFPPRPNAFRHSERR